MYVQSNVREPRYELYITDGTVSPHGTHIWHQNLDFEIPQSAVWTLAIFGDQPPDIASQLIAGNYLSMRNVNVKRHRGQGLLELKWSEKVTPEQREMGWKNRSLSAIAHDDYRATEINRWARFVQDEDF